MTINKEIDENKMTLFLEGRLDTSTAPLLENEIKNLLEDITLLTFNFEKLDYISSAGLRILLSCYKTLKKQGGEIIVKNPNENVTEVFEVTGFCDFLTIEK